MDLSLLSREMCFDLNFKWFGIFGQRERTRQLQGREISRICAHASGRVAHVTTCSAVDHRLEKRHREMSRHLRKVF